MAWRHDYTGYKVDDVESNRNRMDSNTFNGCQTELMFYCSIVILQYQFSTDDTVEVEIIPKKGDDNNAKILIWR